MRTLGLSAVVAALAVLVGCGGPVVVDPAPVDPRVTMYDVTSVDDGGRPRLLVDRYATRLTFYGKRMDVIGGCNVLTGRYRLEGTQLLVSGLAATTKMHCEQEAVDEDAWFAQLFGRPVTFIAGPPASVTSGNVKLALTELHHQVPDAPLTGTPWVLDSWFRGVGLGTWADRHVNATLTLTSVGQGHQPMTPQPSSFLVTAGCAGRFGGAVHVDGAAISWRPAAFDMRTCPARSARVDAEARQLVAVLDGVTGDTIKGDTLVVRDLVGEGGPEGSTRETFLRFHRGGAS